MHPKLHTVLEDEVERLDRVLLANAVHSPDTLLDLHWIPRKVVIDDDVGELQIQTFAACVRGHQDAGFLRKLAQDTPPHLKVHRPVEADHCEAVLLKKIPEHILRRNELRENEVLQLGVVLISLVLVEDVEQGFGPCVRSLRPTTVGQFEQQFDFLFFVLKSSQPGRQKFFQLLLAVLFGQIVVSRFLIRGIEVGGLQRFEAAFHR